MKRIAVTGGPASGKTTACKIFKELGAYVVSSDEIVHRLLSVDSDLIRRVTRSLNLPIPTSSEHLRKVIAEKVFKNPEQLKWLESILHPKILQTIEELYQKVAEEGESAFFIVEMPLLFEIKTEGFYDIVITIIADKDVARKRYEKRGNSDYALRLQNQLPPEIKAEKSDYILTNNGNMSEFETQIKHLYTTLQTKVL